MTPTGSTGSTGTPGAPGAARRGPLVRAVLATALWTATGDRLGMVDVLDTRDEPRLIGRLGPELLADDVIDADLERALTVLDREPGRAGCDALLDQSVVAGIGTIVATESLCRRCGTPISVGQSGRRPRQRPIFFCATCQVRAWHSRPSESSTAR